MDRIIRMHFDHSGFPTAILLYLLGCRKISQKEKIMKILFNHQDTHSFSSIKWIERGSPFEEFSAPTQQEGSYILICASTNAEKSFFKSKMLFPREIALVTKVSILEHCAGKLNASFQSTNNI